MFSIDTYCDIATLKLTAIHAVRAVLIIFIGRWFVRHIVARMKKSLVHLCPDEIRVGIITNFFTYLGYFVVLVAVLYEFGLNITALLGVAGVIGVAVGYASQTSVSNVIGGLFLMLEEPFEMGTNVVIDGIEGKLVELNLFAVTLENADGLLIRIPHCTVVKSVIIKGKK